MTNEELIEKLRDRNSCTDADIDEVSRRLEVMNKFLRHNVFAEKHPGVYFICGEGGEKDGNGMPDHVHICPAYGSDVVYIYMRRSFTNPQW
jgi:hypothetical protein